MIALLVVSLLATVGRSVGQSEITDADLQPLIESLSMISEDESAPAAGKALAGVLSSALGQLVNSTSIDVPIQILAFTLAMVNTAQGNEEIKNVSSEIVSLITAKALGSDELPGPAQNLISLFLDAIADNSLSSVTAAAAIFSLLGDGKVDTDTLTDLLRTVLNAIVPQLPEAVRPAIREVAIVLEDPSNINFEDAISAVTALASAVGDLGDGQKQVEALVARVIDTLAGVFDDSPAFAATLRALLEGLPTIPSISSLPTNLGNIFGGSSDQTE